jgi:hypothetical protein
VDCQSYAQEPIVVVASVVEIVYVGKGVELRTNPCAILVNKARLLDLDSSKCHLKSLRAGK